MKMKETRSEKILLFVVHLSPKVEIVVHRRGNRPLFMQKVRYLRENYKRNKTL